MKTKLNDEKLAEILLRQGAAGEDQLKAWREQSIGGLARWLLENQMLDERSIAAAVAEQFSLPYTSLDGFEVSPELFDLIAPEEAGRLGILPFSFDGKVLEVVVSDPLAADLEERLARSTGHRIRLRLAESAAIHAALDRSRGSERALRDLSGEFRADKPAGEDEPGRYDLEAPDSGPVVRLVHRVLLTALERGASDVHLSGQAKGVSLQYRIDGLLSDAADPVDASHHESMVARLKVMAGLDIAEKRLPQDGRFQAKARGRLIDFRVSVLPGMHGEDIVLRVLDPQRSLGKGSPDLKSLGLEESLSRALLEQAKRPHGMLLMTGPTGSGKTTTLYAVVGQVDRRREKLVTIEDPVEYHLDGALQIAVNEKKGLTFARGLRSILRHDPDKIIVGEIRDAETASIAVQSALTGHLVFTTVHANGASDVIGRFHHMGVDMYGFVSALNGVLAQRLLRRLCAHCRKPDSPAPALLKKQGWSAGKGARAAWHQAAGCKRCGGSGYQGRVAVGEFMVLTPKLRELILQRRGLDLVKAEAVKGGMVSLRQAALKLAASGETSLEEVLRVTDPD